MGKTVGDGMVMHESLESTNGDRRNKKAVIDVIKESSEKLNIGRGEIEERT